MKPAGPSAPPLGIVASVNLNASLPIGIATLRVDLILERLRSDSFPTPTPHSAIRAVPPITSAGAPRPGAFYGQLVAPFSFHRIRRGNGCSPCFTS